VGHAGCEELAIWFTTHQSEDLSFRWALSQELSRQEPDLQAVATIVGTREPRLGSLAREELENLPRPASLAILRAWRDAVDLELPFRLVSELPDGPISFARRRLVRVITDVDQSGITVRLSHVPGHHPAWGPAHAGGNA
jgi:hypothetical protein